MKRRVRYLYSGNTTRQHRVTVTDLAQRFGISEMTIRRDLNFLARQYNISELMGAGGVISL